MTTKPKRRVIKREIREQIRSEALAGAKGKDLAVKYGICPQTVSAILNCRCEPRIAKLRSTPPKPKTVAERKAEREAEREARFWRLDQLSEETKQAIREMRATTRLSPGEIAEEFDIEISTLWKVCLEKKKELVQ